MSDKKEFPEEQGANFDMYHFFSRKDVIVAAIVILVVLIYLLARFLAGGSAHA